MRLSKLSYYADFVIYPPVILGLAAAAWDGGGWIDRTEWFCALGAGMLLWTFLENALHRVALHRLPYFVPLHAEHHRDPLAFVGTPTWMSIAVLCGALLLPGWLVFGFAAAGASTAGVMLGYWWYGVVHHVIHHRTPLPWPAYSQSLRARHMLHHYAPRNGNYGVTTGFWDHVFGTAIPLRDKATQSS